MAKAKYKRKSRATVPGRGPGKPKRVFTDAQMRKMGRLAFEGCQTETIASIMGIPRETIDSRPDIQTFLTKNRADRKQTLRNQQNKSAEGGNVTMQIWLGKNVLDQTDRLETKHDITNNLADFLKAMKDE